MRRLFLLPPLLLVLLLATPTAVAQLGGTSWELDVRPAQPTTADVVEVTVKRFAPASEEPDGCTAHPASLVVAAGGTISMQSAGCQPLIPGAPSFVLGPLEAGTYRISVVDRGQATELGAFTVVEGGPPPQLGTGPVVRAIPGREAFEVVLLDVPDLNGCSPRTVTIDDVRYRGSVVEVFLREIRRDVVCAGPVFPGDVRVAVSEQRTAALQTVAVYYDDSAGPDAYRPLGTVRRTSASGCPVQDLTALCLDDGRFRVTARWTTRDGSGVARPVSLTPDTGAFWFFQPGNLELTVKVLDACAAFDRYWVFISGLTNQGVEIDVHDTVAGEIRTYTNPLGQGFGSIRDTGAFATCDAAP